MKERRIADSVQHFSARAIDTDRFPNDTGSRYEPSQGQIRA